jgi:drug/metabolite transporter (DMT)-like permease
LFWGIVLIGKLRRSANRTDRKRLPVVRILLLGTLFSIASVCAFIGFGLIPAGTYVVIFYCYPAIVAIISMFLGERLSPWGWLALGLTIVGVALSSPDFSAGLSGDNLPGVIVALVNALIVAIYFVASGRLLRGHTALTQASAWACTGALIVLASGAILTGVRFPPDTGSLAALIGMAIVSTIMPVFALTVGIQKLGASRAAIVGSFEPLLTAIIAMIFLQQSMQPIQWVGGAVIVFSVILLQTLGNARDESQLSPPMSSPQSDALSL